MTNRCARPDSHPHTSGTGTSITVASQRLEARFHAGLTPQAPPLVFLHEGLGSISLWRDFPDRLAAATGCPVLVYSRRGYGGSEPLTPPYLRPVDYLHTEALQVLPALLDHYEIQEPILFGHSDGASIALIHAGAAGRPVRAVIAEAPHVMVEPLVLTGINATVEAWHTGKLARRLASHHDHATGTFFGWSETWLSPAFSDWNIEPLLGGIACPVLVIQGEDDQYGTVDQVNRVISQVSGPAQALLIPRCGHSPHREHPDVVLGATLTFLDRHLPRASASAPESAPT
jgi:pimeloyl-ACP methyl ester carboxylesterase